MFRTSSKTGEGVRELFETIALHLITRQSTTPRLGPGEIDIDAMTREEKEDGIFSCLDWDLEVDSILFRLRALDDNLVA